MRFPLPLLTLEVKPLHLRMDNTCLLLQDVHAPFTDHRRGWLSKEASRKVVEREFDEYFSRLELVSGNFEKLLILFRELNLPVVFTCLGYYAPENPSSLQQAMGWDWDLRGGEGKFIDPMKPIDGEMVFSKPGWGSLSSSDFKAFLHNRNLTNVILCGTLFDFGIQHSAYELVDAGHSVLIVSDAVVSSTEAADAPVRGNLGHGMTKFRTTAEVCGLLEGLRHALQVVV
jgi:nicotinamidase-related amidase